MMRGIPTRIEAENPAVATRSLVKRFGENAALRGLDLTVPDGAVYAFVGPNGAGKTTTLRLLLGLLRADGGEVEVLGRQPEAEGPAVRARIGYVPESHEIGYPWLTVGQLMDHHARYFSTWNPEYAARLSTILEIRRQPRFGQLSKGQARRVQILLALAHHPALLLLDEPTDGLDPVARDRVLSILAEHLAATPTTVIVSTHLVQVVEGLVDHLGLVDAGQVVAQGSTEDLGRALRRYRAQVPEGWTPPATLNGSVLRRRGHGGEIAWTIWGDESEVSARLRESGAVLRDVAPLDLEETVLALLDPGGPQLGGAAGVGTGRMG